MAKKSLKKIEKKIEKGARKVLGVTANLRNLFIAVALLFGFLAGFFQIYNWIDTTYTRQVFFKKLQCEVEFKREGDLLKEMYTRLWTLEQMINLSPDSSKIPAEIKNGYNDVKNQIKLQEEKVKVLQEKMVK
jgi:hypothetical protein